MAERRDTHWTMTCRNTPRRQHVGRCHGFVAPLVWAGTRPCECPCHDNGNPRDFPNAINQAKGAIGSS